MRPFECFDSLREQESNRFIERTHAFSGVWFGSDAAGIAIVATNIGRTAANRGIKQPSQENKKELRRYGHILYLDLPIRAIERFRNVG